MLFSFEFTDSAETPIGRQVLDLPDVEAVWKEVTKVTARSEYQATTLRVSDHKGGVIAQFTLTPARAVIATPALPNKNNSKTVL